LTRMFIAKGTIMKNKQLYPSVLFACCLFWILTNWVFIRYIHYHSQNRLLNPADYHVRVVTDNDYQKLSNPANREIKLSNGTKLIKADLWNSRVLKHYKAIEAGSRYVLVTLNGTAPFVRDWQTTMIPLFILSAAGLALSRSSYRRSRIHKPEA